MKLKIEGKLRDGFFEWLDKTYPDSNIHGEPSGFSHFNIPQSAQFGLLQEYADTLGIVLTIKFVSTEYGFKIHKDDGSIFESKSRWYNSRPEAQVAAIEKLNEIVNK